MIAIRQQRKWTGGMLILFGVFLVIWLIAIGREGLPWWGWVFFACPLLVALGIATYGFFAGNPELLIQDGHIVIPRGSVFAPLARTIRIPLKNVRHARIVRVDDAGGCSRWLEVCMTCLPPNLVRWKKSRMKRFQVAMERPFGYRPPAEPFLLFPIALLEVGDEEIAKMIQEAKAELESDGKESEPSARSCAQDTAGKV